MLHLIPITNQIPLHNLPYLKHIYPINTQRHNILLEPFFTHQLPKTTSQTIHTHTLKTFLTTI